MEHILVADDNRDNREYLVSLFRYKDYEVTEAEDGQEALALIRDNQPDLVICDILMPVIDGYGFVHRLRRDSDIAGTRIIFYTAHYLEGEASSLAASVGVSLVLEKPCEPEEMLKRVRETLDTPAVPPPQQALDTFNDEHLRLVTDKLYNKTAEISDLNQRLAALVELNLQLASERNPHQLLNQVCHGARELTGARYGALAVKDGMHGRPHYFTTSGVNSDQLAAIIPGSIDQGILGDVIKTSHIKRLKKINGNVNTGLPGGFPESNNLIAVPIMSLTSTYGWLCLTGKQDGDEFSDEDEQLISILSAQTGRIYENGSLYTKIRFHSSQLEQEIAHRNRVQLRLETQYEVSRILSGATTFEEAIPDLLDTIATHIGFDVGFMWEADEDGEELHCAKAWYSPPSPELAEFVKQTRALTIPRGTGFSGEVWRSGMPKWVPDMLDEVDRYQTPSDLIANYQAAGLHAAVAFPIVLGEKVWGIQTFYSREILMEDGGILEMFSAISGQIGQFMERRIQQQHINWLNRVHAVLSGINNTIVHVHDREELFRKTCDIVVNQGRFQMTWIGFLDDNTGELTSLNARSSSGLRGNKTIAKKLNRKKDKELVREFLTHHDPIVRNHLRSDQKFGFPLSKEAIKQGVRSAAAFPLKVEGKDSGLLALYSTEPGFFDEQEMLLLKELSEDLSFAMQFIRNEEQLNFLAYHDPITGLKNRIAMYIELARATKAAAKQDKPFAILLVNINDFRDINDTLGHKNGDELLKQVAGRLRDTVWDTDTVACLGGDDFAILLPHLADKDHIHLVIEKISKSLEGAFSISDLPVNVEVTTGISLFPDHGTSADVLWQRADVALRHARETHQRHVFYSIEIDDYDPQRLSLIGDLRRGIENDQLILHYQPLVDLSSNKTVGVEALVRWQHPEHGIIFPDQFIPYSEHTGLINLLTSWVLRNAMKQISSWNRDGFDLELAVNISAYNLHNPQLVKEILDLTRKFQFPVEKLNLEITETAIMVDPKLASQVLTELFQQGIQISIDDFGTGQSSLSYLKDLPVNRMKIDKSFVIGFHEARNRGIVKSSVDLAHNLGLVVTAEGVEDEDSLRQLQSYGCDQVQGYYLCRPASAENLEVWLRDSAWPCTTPE